MALAALAGLGSWEAYTDGMTFSPAFTSILCDAAADRIVMWGRFTHKDGVTKTVDGAGFLFGAVSKGAGSTFKLSLQDVDLATGPPGREDATPDQTISIANANAGFATNLWFEAAFDGAATRSLTPGDRVAVVLQFDTFAASDTVNIRGLGLTTSTTTGDTGTTTNLTGTYAAAAVLPNVVLRCDDGTYGTLEYAFVCSAITTHAFHLNTATADEYAMALQFPYPCRLTGLAITLAPTTAADQTELLLYSGTTALSTVTLDHNAMVGVGTRPLREPILPQVLAANTLYRLAVRPTGTNNVTIFSFDVNTVNHFQCHPFDLNFHQWTRLDQGAWGGEVTTRRLFAGMRLSAFDDGAGGGGGLIAHSLIAGGG